jgi:hypothetical protein
MPDPNPPQTPRPDVIEPQSPDESPAHQTPTEQPMQQPDEVNPVQPDQIQPSTSPDEVPQNPGN